METVHKHEWKQLSFMTYKCIHCDVKYTTCYGGVYYRSEDSFYTRGEPKCITRKVSEDGNKDNNTCS